MKSSAGIGLWKLAGGHFSQKIGCQIYPKKTQHKSVGIETNDWIAAEKKNVVILVWNVI